MRIVCFISGISVDGANLFFRNPQWYQKPEHGFDCVIAKEQHILDDYKKIGVPEYAVLQKEERREPKEEVVEDSKIVEELSWNEMRRLAKELSGEVIKSKEQAHKVLKDHGIL
jgi:hypothetical protein